MTFYLYLTLMHTVHVIVINVKNVCTYSRYHEHGCIGNALAGRLVCLLYSKCMPSPILCDNYYSLEVLTY